jgi:membrane-associated phospholipid phosphatase
MPPSPRPTGSLSAMSEAQSVTASPRRTWRQRYPWLVPGGLLLLLTLLIVNVLADGPLFPADKFIHKVIHHTSNSPDWSWLKDGPATPARILVDLGNIRVAFPILLVIAAYAALDRHSLRPLLTAVTGMVLVLATVVPLKILVGRPNPSFGPLRQHELLGAFPSGHTTTACVCYVLAALLVTPDPGSRARPIALRAAAVLGVLVGMAMIWCNKHWLTDVVGGFALAGLIVPFTMWLTDRGRNPQRPGRPPPDESRALAASAEQRGPDS